MDRIELFNDRICLKARSPFALDPHRPEMKSDLRRKWEYSGAKLNPLDPVLEWMTQH